MDNLTLISCSYNTPLVTITMIKSFLFHNGLNKVLICENSTNDDTEKLLIDNNVKYVRNVGGLHSPSVDILLNNVKTKYALLVDTDIVFLKSVSSLYDQFVKNDLCLLGEVEGDRGGKKIFTRVHPWFCLIDVEKILSYGIKFFDIDKINLMNNNVDGRICDVGSQFFAEVKSNNFKIGAFNGNGKYYFHYEGMSWRSLRYDPTKEEKSLDMYSDGTHNIKGYYDMGKEVERYYFEVNKEYDKYKNVDIKSFAKE